MQAKGEKGGGERTGDTANIGTRCGTPGSGRDLGIRSRTESEVNERTSGGSRRVGAASRWTDLRAWASWGGEAGTKERSGAESKHDRWGESRSLGTGGGG